MDIYIEHDQNVTETFFEKQWDNLPSTIQHFGFFPEYLLYKQLP